MTAKNIVTILEVDGKVLSTQKVSNKGYCYGRLEQVYAGTCIALRSRRCNQDGFGCFLFRGPPSAFPLMHVSVRQQRPTVQPIEKKSSSIFSL